MFAAYLTITLLTSAVIGSAAVANFIGHDYVERQAEALRVPRSWKLPLGTLLAAGALGLLVGTAAPLLGTLAAGGLVLYFVGAFAAHLRVGDYHFGPWAAFFGLSVAALVANLTYHGYW